MKKPMIISVVLILSIICGAVWYTFRKHDVPFEKIATITGECKYRTEDNKPYDMLLYTWYPISREQSTAFAIREINEFIDTGVILDFENYCYVVAWGFSMKRLSWTYWYSEKSKGRNRVYTGIIEYGYDCEPDAINLYQIPKIFIVPEQQFRNQKPFYIFE